MDWPELIAELQTMLVAQGAVSQPVQCGQITLNINDGRVASVHINAVVKIHGKPKDWHIPLRMGVLLDNSGELSVK